MSDFASGFPGRGEWVLLGYLANAVWQVPLVFGAAWIGAKMARRAGAAAEHRAWVVALWLEAVLPAARMDVRAAWIWVMTLFAGRSRGPAGSVQVVMG